MKAIKEMTIHEMFELQAERTPDHTAVHYDGQSITYSQLNSEANRLGRKLLELTAYKKGSIGIYIDKGIHGIISMIAVLKTGCSFIILDKRWSKERVLELIKSASVELVLTNAENQTSAFALREKNRAHFEVYCPDFISMGYEKQTERVKNLDIPVSHTADAHIYFTSGSTGNSKGIVGPHKVIVHLANFLVKEFNFGEKDRFSQLSSLSFDSSLRDIFIPLFCGATVCIPTEDVFTEPKKLLHWLDSEGITVIQCVPSIYNRIAQAAYEEQPMVSLSSLQYIFQAGEALNKRNMRNWQERYGDQMQFINLYGTTETMVKSYYAIDLDRLPYMKIIPIGRPIANTELLILNENNKLCKVKETGILFVRTPYLTKGYLNREKLTKKSFIQNPLHQDYEDIIYCTGDLAAYLPDGNVMLLGRKDSQVKIQGVRIEIDEIESVIKELEGVKEAAVIVGDEEQTELFAYIETERTYEEAHIRNYLTGKIPVVCIPNHICFLEKMPQNTNGKIDRSLLKTYKPTVETKVIAAGSTKVQHKLIVIWEIVLKRSQIQLTDNYFKLGGDSLQAMQIISRMKDVFQIEIKFMDFYRNPSIYELSRLLESMEPSLTERSIKKLPSDMEYYQCSYAQERMWILNRMDSGGISYNISLSYEIDGRIDEARLEKALYKTVEKHEILRTSFHEIDREIKQKIHAQDSIPSGKYFISTSDMESDAGSVEQNVAKTTEFVFELSEVPLFKVQLIKTEREHFILVVCIHHIICDGWSINVLMDEIMRQYKAQNSGNEISKPLSIQYKDYAAWQKESVENKEGEEQSYWLKRLSGTLPVVSIPSDYKRPLVKTYSGSNLYFEMEPELIHRMKNYCKQQNISLYVFLLTALNLLIYKYTGEKEILVGSSVSGRNRTELEDGIGLYINTIVLRNSLDEKESTEALIQKVKETVTKDLEHQTYPFDKLVNELNIPRDPSRNAIFDLMLIIQNQEKAETEMDRFRIEQRLTESQNSKFDITFMFIEEGEQLLGKFEYNTDLYSEKTIHYIKEHLLRIFDNMIEYPSAPICSLQMITSQEENYIHQDFNQRSMKYADETIVTYFEQCAVKYAEQVCVKDERYQYTYSQVNKRANQLSRHLLKLPNYQEASFTGICMKHSCELIISILAILKTKKGFLLLDAGTPKERNERILQDASVRYLLTDGMGKDGAVCRLDVTDEGLYTGDKENLDLTGSSDDAAYILYTSGTSGTPKGVLITHEGLFNYVMWAAMTYVGDKSCNAPLFTSAAFDLTLTSIFVPLLTGGTITAIAESGIKNLFAVFTNKEWNLVKLTPSHLKIINKIAKESAYQPDASQNDKAVVVGGENLSSNTAADTYRFLGITSLFNEYGPTEAVIGCMVKKFNIEEGGEFVPIGVPASNTKIYILDSILKLVPFGVVGELYIARKGLSKGYLNLPEETESKFINNPFENNDVLYRTGDLGYINSEGEIVFVGRLDEQVKVRGYRVELEEIEQALNSIEGIQDAAVLYEEAEDMLSGYLVTEKEWKVIQLRAVLRELLPTYMIPDKFYTIPEIPLTVNGKRQKNLIKERGIEIKSVSITKSTSNQTQAILFKAWNDILGHDEIDIQDNFFDVGGNSLKVIQLVEYLGKNHGWNISIVTVFQYPSIHLLSEYMNRQSMEIDNGTSAGKKDFSKEKMRMKQLRERNYE